MGRILQQRIDLLQAARPNNAPAPPVPASNPTTTAGYIDMSGTDRNLGQAVDNKEVSSSALVNFNGYLSVENTPVTPEAAVSKDLSDR